MGAYLGAGWSIVHLTDRCIELRKPDALYRRFTGRDGYVRVRGELGMDRNALIERAMTVAMQSDERLALTFGTAIIPRLTAAVGTGLRVQMEPTRATVTGGAKIISLADHRELQRRLSRTFATPEDPERRVCRP